ncbi:hypothetical protein CcaverHIS002_0404530 [Cutaneotrichosporon cavernicola]|uniref:PQ-loop-domain-containing protein n=1 Tax=Cutaneotrichosporon cavernicola TaxID=279322 RepID=A0AA48L474_9TREE|nr:uncharacterized protein CcaverHIS019_0404500 [Cutaneotrichosporon cavernicola]BEI83849.1 hypothetical protein CcaverHIS002_0404530 [Cutaneotrichosporon cavernicola]BEI91630.1 hypothetical protein CcaverHIS019_0404500 [Cutaneotrichosporon cavernicola]BEI99406.1 hypothetical protein CcaverHIS631_0404490 [Cutaneotrichosporon cavernicola]BEJ07183.1 hypothetical protein CcaverHIS641_0404520 [Cutaneotrichosporon cavernicola]
MMAFIAPPPQSEELSSVMGYMSIACWIVVYSPQIYENYVLKSGEGLSVPFIILWLLGDMTNLVGAIYAGLLPTMIILAVYYNLCDVVLIYQVYYYRWLRRKRREADGERQPLVELDEPKVVKPILPAYLLWPLLVGFVLAVGWIAHILHENDDVKIPDGTTGGGVELEWKSQVLGYTSCVLYMLSRVPQVFHNFRTRCEGLSLAMFFFSISGNVTYIASILMKSTDYKYLVTNASWIAGSAFTIFLDLFIIGQFAYYTWQDSQKAPVFANDEDDE